MKLSDQLRELYPVWLRDTAGPIFYIQGKAVNVNTLIAQACHLESRSNELQEIDAESEAFDKMLAEMKARRDAASQPQPQPAAYTGGGVEYFDMHSAYPASMARDVAERDKSIRGAVITACIAEINKLHDDDAVKLDPVGLIHVDDVIDVIEKLRQ